MKSSNLFISPDLFDLPENSLSPNDSLGLKVSLLVFQPQSIRGIVSRARFTSCGQVDRDSIHFFFYQSNGICHLYLPRTVEYLVDWSLLLTELMNDSFALGHAHIMHFNCASFRWFLSRSNLVPDVSCST